MAGCCCRDNAEGMTTPHAPVSASQAGGLLRRSRADRVVAGVCGGLGRHFGVDPVLLRIAFIALTLAGGSGVLVYVIAWIAIPEVPAGAEEPAAATPLRHSPHLVIGAALLLLGAALLVNVVAPGFDRFVWPLVLVGVGAALLLRGERS